MRCRPRALVVALITKKDNKKRTRAKEYQSYFRVLLLLWPKPTNHPPHSDWETSLFYCYTMAAGSLQINNVIKFKVCREVGREEEQEEDEEVH